MTLHKRLRNQPRSSLVRPAAGGKSETLPLSRARGVGGARRVGGRSTMVMKFIAAFGGGALAILFSLSFLLQDPDKSVNMAFFARARFRQSIIYGGEQDVPKTDSNTTSVPSTKVQDLKILLYVTTHMSPGHVWYLKSCWPEAMKHSLVLRSADVAIYLNSPLDQREDNKKVLKEAFKHNHLDIHERDNPGYQEGALAAISDATKEGWFSGYDWVIRLNPDVIIRDESFLVDTMENDPDATGLFINCDPNGLVRADGLKIHTDFFAIKPAVLKPDAFLKPAEGNAEYSFTQDVREVILEKNNHRWIPGANPETPKRCRAGYKKSLTDTPITHNHFFGIYDDDDDAWTHNYTCPLQFV